MVSVFSLKSLRLFLSSLVLSFSCSGVLSLLEELDTLVEGGHDLSLRDAETGGWGDIDGTVLTNWGVLTTETTNGETEWLGHFLGLLVSAVLGEVGEGNVHGSTHAGTNVGWAGGDDTVVWGHGAAAIDVILDDLDGLLESVEDLVEHGALLHAHDAEMVLLTNPDDELSVLGHVAATTVWPVTGNTSGDEVGVSGHILEHDVVLNVLVVLGGVDEALVTWGDGNVVTTEGLISDEGIEDLLHVLLHVDTIILGHGTWEWVLVEVTASTDSHGEGWEAKVLKVELTRLWETLNTSEGPVVDVLLDVQVNSVVLGESLLEEWGELVVVLWLHGIAAHGGILVGNTREAAGEETDLLVLGQGVVMFLIEGLGHAVIWVLGLDLKDLLDDLRSGLSVDDEFAVLGFDTTFNSGSLAAHLL